MTKTDKQLLHIYYIIQIILFLIIKVLEQTLKTPGGGDPGIQGTSLAIFRYHVIVCNFLMMSYLYLQHGQRFTIRDNLIPLAFTLTLLADTCMCVLQNARPMGYLLFAIVETVYMIHMRPTWKSVLARLIIYAAMLLVLRRIKMFTPEYMLAMANMVQLTVNLFCAWIQKFRIKSRKTLLFALGITLFVGCDYSILVRTLVEKPLSTSHPVYLIAAFIAWTCYIPSQVFLLCSYVEKLRQKTE